MRPHRWLNTTLAGLLLVASDPLAATTVKGIILANEMGGPGIANVQVSAIEGANPILSLSDGKFVLDFPNKQPGDKVQLIVKRPGMVVVNYLELRFTLPKDTNADPLILLLCRADERQEMTRRYYRIDSIEQGYRKKLEDLQMENQANEAAREQLRIERDLAREEAEKLARAKVAEVSDSTSTVYRSVEAMALNNLGIMYIRQNRMENARKTFDKALRISREKAQQDPNTYLPDVEETLNNLGNMFSNQNRMQEAREAYDEALVIGNKLVEQNPATYQPGVASTLNNLGTLLRKQNRMEEARVAFERALTLYRERAQANPATYLPHVPETLKNLGNLNGDQNRMEEAWKAFREALAIYEDLARRNPGQYTQEVESTYDEALEIIRKLARQNPTTYLPVVADTLNNLGNILSGQDRMREAWEVYDEALKISRKPAEQNPDTYLPSLATTLNNVSTFLRKQNGIDEARNTFDEALGSYRGALEAYRKQHQSEPPTIYLPKIAMILTNLGNLSRDHGRGDEARKDYNEALVIRRKLAQQNPDTHLLSVAETLHNLGNLDLDQNRMEDARIVSSEALAVEALFVYETLTTEKPGKGPLELAYAPELVTTYDALEISGTLAQQGPATYLPKIALMLIDIGVSKRDPKEAERARVERKRKAFSKAVDIYENLIPTNPELYGQKAVATRRLLDDLDRPNA